MKVTFGNIDSSEFRQLIVIFLLGFSSGLPFLLILSTLNVWFTEVGVSKTQIGMFSWVTISYALKFIWAPFLDLIKIPILSKCLGHRRSWLLLAQVALLFSLIFLGFSKPSHNLVQVALAAFFVGFFSSLQDIIVEFYRVEAFSEKHLGLSSSVSVIGYRCGMLCSGAGALYLSAFLKNWHVAYILMAFVMLIGIMTTLLSKEPVLSYVTPNASISKVWHKIIVKPLISFAHIPNIKIILSFIVCFKLADTVLVLTSVPFLLEIGFSKVQLAHVSKTFGISAMMVGGILGGVFLNFYNVKSFLYLCAVLGVFASILFFLQAIIGNNFAFLFVTIGFENIASGMLQVGFIAYFSQICRQQQNVVYYAILSSVSSLIRVNLSVLAGYFADLLNWTQFYFVLSIACIPAIVLLWYYREHFNSIKDINLALNSKVIECQSNQINGSKKWLCNAV